MGVVHGFSSRPDKVRICIDPFNLNQAIKREDHPMKTIEEVASRLPGAKIFSTLDTASGFWQIQLDEESANLTCFNTPFRRYKFNRLPFGITSAPEVFQRTVEMLFEDIDGCEIIVDDILVWGKDEDEHDRRLVDVLERAQKINLKLRKEKCKIKTEKLLYIGHQLTANGLKPDVEKVAAIAGMPELMCKKDVQRFIGMIQHLAKFIPKLSEKAQPLRNLLKKDTAWQWNHEQQKAFQDLQQACCEPPILKYYDVTKPVTISADSSQSGLGAVCMQEGQPVAYASRALTMTQQTYAQIEKEMLAIVFACEKFHNYIYGREVEVETDHKPLIYIFKKPLHECPARLQRMRLRLQQYQLKVCYKKGCELYIADTLSRAYLVSKNDDSLEEKLEVHIILPMSTERLEQLRVMTSKDPILQVMKTTIEVGWPASKSQVNPVLGHYWDFKEELAVHDDVIFKNDKVIIPTSLRPFMLKAVHQPHLGITASKRRAPELMYWPGINKDIEKMVKTCEVCNSHQKPQQKEPLHSHPVPSRPFERIGADLFEFEQKQYLITADFYSGWFEIDLLPSPNTSTVIQKLKAHMSRYGIPDVLMTDNGPQFDSCEFKQFQKRWGFQHITSSPCYPQSNGGIERAVQTAKLFMQKARDSGEDCYLSLLNQPNTPRDDVLGSSAQ